MKKLNYLLLVLIIVACSSNDDNNQLFLEKYDNVVWKNPLLENTPGHSKSSIKMMLGNAVSRLSGESTFLGTELYAEVVQEYLEANPRFNKPMSIEKFKLLFL